MVVGTYEPTNLTKHRYCMDLLTQNLALVGTAYPSFRRFLARPDSRPSFTYSFRNFLSVSNMRSLLALVLLCTAAWAVEHSVVRAASPDIDSTDLKQRALLQSLRTGARRVKQGRKSVFGPARTNPFRNTSRKGRKGAPSSAFSPTSNFSPVRSPVASSTFSTDSFFQNSKGRGKGSRGKGKGGKGGKQGGRKRGGELSKKKGKKRRSICSRFEFQFDRRRLQFEGADCEDNVFDMVSRIDELSIFASLLEASGIDDILSCGGPFTVLAPVDDAFDGIDFSTVSRQSVEEFLYSHIVPGVVLEDDFGVGTMESLAGNNIAVHTPPLSFNSATAIETDIVSCNGVLFLTDSLVTNFGEFSHVPEFSSNLLVFQMMDWMSVALLTPMTALACLALSTTDPIVTMVVATTIETGTVVFAVQTCLKRSSKLANSRSHLVSWKEPGSQKFSVATWT